MMFPIILSIVSTIVIISFFITVLYVYAKTGSVPDGFDSNLIAGVFKKKKKKFQNDIK